MSPQPEATLLKRDDARWHSMWRYVHPWGHAWLRPPATLGDAATRRRGDAATPGDRDALEVVNRV